MLQIIKEEKIAKAWVLAGITPDEAKSQLISSDNYVSLSGEVTKVYGAKVLAIMHSLAKKPVLVESKFSIA